MLRTWVCNIIYYSSCQNIWKVNRLKVKTFHIYHFDFFPIIIEDSENNSLSISNSTKFFKEKNISGGKKYKILHFYIFGYEVYIFLSNEVCINKFMLHSNLYVIYKKMLFSALYMLSSSRNSFLNILTFIWKSVFIEQSKFKDNVVSI